MKYNRHAKILEIIEENVIVTQEELAQKLKEQGFDVTQATVSRDIKELRLIKVMSQGEQYRYSVITNEESNISEKLLTILKQSHVSSDYANNIVVIKTLSGMAQAAAAALDSLKWSEVVGTIAGDDTIMIVCRAERMAEDLVNRMNKLVGNK